MKWFVIWFLIALLNWFAFGLNLRLLPGPFSSAAARTVVAFDRELAAADLRALRRYLLWVSRGGVRPEPAIDRPS